MPIFIFCYVWKEMEARKMKQCKKGKNFDKKGNDCGCLIIL